jgi:hypothetical protein
MKQWRKIRLIKGHLKNGQKLKNSKSNLMPKKKKSQETKKERE